MTSKTEKGINALMRGVNAGAALAEFATKTSTIYKGLSKAKGKSLTPKLDAKRSTKLGASNPATQAGTPKGGGGK